MNKRTKYPHHNFIIDLNKLIIQFFREKKIGDNWRGDRHQLKNRAELKNVLEEMRKVKGDLYYKASFLLIKLCQKHLFASANRRTAFYGAIAFLEINEEDPKVKDEPSKSKIMLGIREKDCYSLEEISLWLKDNKIKIKKVR